jgi:hypothetical protein
VPFFCVNYLIKYYSFIGRSNLNLYLAFDEEFSGAENGPAYLKFSAAEYGLGYLTFINAFALSSYLI